MSGNTSSKSSLVPMAGSGRSCGRLSAIRCASSSIVAESHVYISTCGGFGPIG
jgi:hypothetical protein